MECRKVSAADIRTRISIFRTSKLPLVTWAECMEVISRSFLRSGDLEEAWEEWEEEWAAGWEVEWVEEILEDLEEVEVEEDMRATEEWAILPR